MTSPSPADENTHHHEGAQSGPHIKGDEHASSPSQSQTSPPAHHFSPFWWSSVAVVIIIALGLTALAFYYHNMRNAGASAPPHAASPSASANSRTNDELMARLTALEQRLIYNDAHQNNGAISAAPSSLSGESTAADSLAPEIEALRMRLAQLEQAWDARAQQTAATNAAPARLPASLIDKINILNLAAALQIKIATGQAYNDEITSLDALHIDHAGLAFLRAHVQSFAQERRQLRQLPHDIAAVQRALNSATASEQAADVSDKILLGIKNLVRITPLNGSAPQDDTTAKIAQFIEDGDLTAALRAWEQLPPALQERSKESAQALRYVLAAQNHSRAFYLDALQALRDQGAEQQGSTP